MNILITGATGEYGRLAIQHIKAIGTDAKLFGLIREEGTGEELEAQGVTTRVADYDDRAALERAFEGIDRLLFVSVPTPDIQKNVVEAAKSSGVGYIIYTSIFAPELGKIGLEANHLATEALIKDSGIPYTILRNSWYLDLHLAPLAMANQKGQIWHATGNGLTVGALKSEYAEVAARLILEGTPRGVVDLTSTPFSYSAWAEAIGQALGKEIKAEEVSEAELASHLESLNFHPGLKASAPLFQAYIKAGGNGEAEATSDNFEQLLGHPLTPLKEAAQILLKEGKG